MVKRTETNREAGRSRATADRARSILAEAVRDGVIVEDCSVPYVTQLARQLEAFAAVSDVYELSADETAELLLVMANAAEQLETQTSHVALQAHYKGVGKHLGSSSTGAWLAHRANVTPSHAHRMIRRSETEHKFAPFYLAHADGKITGYHVDHLANLWRNNPHVVDLLHRDEQLLCDAACTLSPAEFGLACQKWLSLADPDGAYEKYLLDLERRFLASKKDIDGNLHIVGRLDPVTGEAFQNLVTRRAQELFEQDWALAKAQAAEGVEVTKDRLRRSDGQRRLDALMSLVIDGSSTPEGAQRPEPLLYFGLDSVTFEEYLAAMLADDLSDQHDPDHNDPDHNDPDHNDPDQPDPDHNDPDHNDPDHNDPDHNDADHNDADHNDPDHNDPGRGRRPSEPFGLLGGPSTGAAVDPNRRCETGQGWPVPWRVMLEQVMTCQIRRVVFGAPSVVLDAGELRRLFSPVQREAIKHRDRCCTFPGCHRDAVYCETDHIVAVVDGGKTDVANGQCLCRYHHRLKTKGRFCCERGADGVIGFYLPNGHQIE